MSDERSSYGSIFKTTFLFGFVQVVNILTKVAVNKVVALLLGAEGLGMISLYNSTLMMLKSGCGLGIKQSAIRDIADAKGSGNKKRISEIIHVTNVIVIFTALLGLVVSIILAPALSKYSFGSICYVGSFLLLSIAVALNIYAEGQMAILTGVRKLRTLAVTTILGSVIGALFSIPFYFKWGKEGIIPSLIFAALSLFAVTKYYVHKIEVDKVRMTIKQSFRKARPMVKMGGALMIAGFSGLLFDLLVSSFIRYEGGFESVGIYQAGATIISSYFGIILTAMTTDYYPRICSVNDDNHRLKEELNKQVTAGLIMIYPLAVGFVYLAPIFLTFLYSSEFSSSTQYTDYAICGTMLIIVSNCMGMIFMAKMDSGLYLRLVLIIQFVLLIIYLPFYHFLGLEGLGIAYIMNGLISGIVYGVVLNNKYNILIDGRVFKLLIQVIVTILITLIARQIVSPIISFAIGSLIFLFVFQYSYKYLKKEMNIDLLSIITKKLR